MSKRPKIQLFLCNRSDNVLQLEQIIEIYKKDIEPIFIFDDKKREAFVDQKMRTLERSYDGEEEAYSHACTLLSLKEKMAYQYLCFAVVQLYSTFEQQIVRNFREELTRGNLVTTAENGEEVVYSYELFNQDKSVNDAFKCLELIEGVEGQEAWWNSKCFNEFRLLNNCIKHGLGKSFFNLKASSPNLIHSHYLNEPDVFDLNNHNKLPQAIILEEVLNLSINKLEEYKDMLVGFWRNNAEDHFYI